MLCIERLNIAIKILPMNCLQRYTFRNFWLRWVIATIVGIATSTCIAIVVGLDVNPIPFASITLSGFIVGFAQWQVLRRVLPKMFWWVVVNSFGSLLGIYGWFFSFVLLKGIIPRDWRVFSSLIIYSFIIEYLQFLVLKKYITQAFLWIPYNTAALIFSFIISLTFRSLVRHVGHYPTLEDWIILGLAHSFMQATILTWLLQNKRIIQEE